MMRREDGSRDGYATPEPIIRELREGGRLIGEGQRLAEMQAPGDLRADLAWLGGAVRRDDGRRRELLKELERENARQKIVADQLLRIDMLKGLSRGSW